MSYYTTSSVGSSGVDKMLKFYITVLSSLLAVMRDIDVTILQGVCMCLHPLDLSGP